MFYSSGADGITGFNINFWDLRTSKPTST